MFDDLKTKITSKASSIFTSPKAVKVLNAVNGVCASGLAAAVTGFAVSAEDAGIDWGATITSASAISEISKNASGFVEPAIIVMCAVSGLRLGWRFLRSAAR